MYQYQTSTNTVLYAQLSKDRSNLPVPLYESRWVPAAVDYLINTALVPQRTVQYVPGARTVLYAMHDLFQYVR